MCSECKAQATIHTCEGGAGNRNVVFVTSVTRGALDVT